MSDREGQNLALSNSVEQSCDHWSPEGQRLFEETIALLQSDGQDRFITTTLPALVYKFDLMDWTRLKTRLRY
jgi:hypothetical protein